jgi:hypothetical protein
LRILGGADRCPCRAPGRRRRPNRGRRSRAHRCDRLLLCAV